MWVNPFLLLDYYSPFTLQIRTEQDPPTFANTSTRDLRDEDDESEHDAHRRHHGVRSNSTSKDSESELKADPYPYRQDIEVAYVPAFGGDVKGVRL